MLTCHPVERTGRWSADGLDLRLVEDQLTTRVLAHIASILQIDGDQIDVQTPLEAIAGWDSMATMQAIVILEDDFGMRFSDTEIRSGWLNVQAIIDSIRQGYNR